MTVEQMTLLSRMFLGFMVAFLIVAVILYFFLDIRKSFQIIVGTKIKLPVGRKRRTEELNRRKNSGGLNGQRVAKTDKKPSRSSELTAVLESGTEVLEPGTAVLESGTAVLDHGTAVLAGAEPQNHMEEPFGVTTALETQGGPQTTVLKGQVQKTDSLDIIMDITFIHTSVTV